MTTVAATLAHPPLRTDSAIGGRLLSRVEGPLVTALGFFCFMPYPGYPIGNATAVTIGNGLTLLLLAMGGLTLAWRQRPAMVFLFVHMPLIISAVKAAITGSGDIELSFKFVTLWGLACLTMVAVQLYAPRHGLRLLTGIAIATLVHTAVGFWQLYSFSNNEFPMLDLYVNQSFTSIADNVSTIAKWVQRPFGIFPEPSAMSSSLAPWILLWVAELCGIIRFRQEPTRRQRMLFSAAAAGGLVLIIISQSGHVFITLSAIVLFGLIWLSRARATRQTFGIVAAVFGLLLPLVVVWGIASMSDRIGGGSQIMNSSWDERSSSLIIGFYLWAQGDPATILFGLGAGQASVVMERAAGLTAVWSVSLVYLYETGLVGALALTWIGALLLRIFQASGRNIAFAAIFVVWLFGITFVTSYPHLLPIWVTLGWLTVWPEVCTPVKSKPARQPRPVGQFNPRQEQSWPDLAGAHVPTGDAPAIDPIRG